MPILKSSDSKKKNAAAASKKAPSSASKKAPAAVSKKAAASAPPASTSKKAAAPAKQQRVISDSRKMIAECRVKLYDDYRKKCSAKGAECELVKQCGQYGVGSELWPVDQYRMDDENFAKHREKYGPQAARQGKECMNRVMWGDGALRKQLEEACGGTVPAFLLLPAAAPGAVPGAVAAPAAKAPSKKAPSKKGLFS